MIIFLYTIIPACYICGIRFHFLSLHTASLDMLTTHYFLIFVHRIMDLRFLHTFDESGVISEYRGTAADISGGLFTFNGAGSLVIVGDHAYFKSFLIDPRVRHSWVKHNY